jgi:hypothetical protein
MPRNTNQLLREYFMTDVGNCDEEIVQSTHSPNINVEAVIVQPLCSQAYVDVQCIFDMESDPSFEECDAICSINVWEILQMLAYLVPKVFNLCSVELDIICKALMVLWNSSGACSRMLIDIGQISQHSTRHCGKRILD